MERVDEKVTARLNLDWTPNDRDLWYFSVTSGYRSGGFNLVFFSTTYTYDPEELTAYEIGYKGQFLNDTLQVFASTYYYDYDNIHTFGSEVSAVTGGTTTSVLEAPGAEIKGFEAEILWLATDNITIGGNVSYTPSEYTKTLLIQDAADFRFPDDLIPNQDTNLDIKGNRVLQVPDYKGSAFVTWDYPMGDRGDLSVTFAASWISEVYFSQFETDFDRAPAYERYDLRATWMSPNKNWIVTGFVHNLTDDIGIRQIEPHGVTDGYRRTGQVTEPRLYGLEVTWSLN
jgi:iron complex outermembrane receptor protein